MTGLYILGALVLLIDGLAMLMTYIGGCA